MSNPALLVDFGASDEAGAHIFHVEIPSTRNQPVIIREEYGYHGLTGGVPAAEERVRLRREVWSGISETARREFNIRLKAAEQAPGRWHSGINKVDRLLGKELCVLAWAAETASEVQIPIICGKWAVLRPEERWWLFSMTAAEAGLPDDTKRGWRRALFLALSDGEKATSLVRKPRPAETENYRLPLFED